MNNVKDLIASLREAGEGSRELDVKIARALGRVWNEPLLNFHTDYDGSTIEVMEDGSSWKLIPGFTTSLDAIVGLIREKLPGRHWSVQTTGEPGSGAYSAEISASAPYRFNVICYTAPTPALALCIALLVALEPGHE